MAKNRSSHFELTEDLFLEKKEQEQTQVANLSALFSPGSEHRPLGVTQGKKGQKAKRINMAFSDENYSYITYESRRRGLSATAFVNMVLEQYRNGPEGHVD